MLSLNFELLEGSRDLPHTNRRKPLLSALKGMGTTQIQESNPKMPIHTTALGNDAGQRVLSQPAPIKSHMRELNMGSGIHKEDMGGCVRVCVSACNHVHVRKCVQQSGKTRLCARADKGASMKESPIMKLDMETKQSQ